MRTDDDFIACDSKCIRAGNDPGGATKIVLDSGADGSVLPPTFLTVGSACKFGNSSSYVDAQGNPILLFMILALLMFDLDTQCFVNVLRLQMLLLRCCLWGSPGKLLRDGWTVVQGTDGLVLQKSGRSIPFHFRRNSLCAYGSIRAFSKVRKI